MTFTPFGALAELVAQHDGLRILMDRCELLADDLDASGGDASELARTVEQLRAAFELHNSFEEHLLRPVLLAGDPHAAVRIERMVDDHLNEHAQLRARLGSPVTHELRDVVETLRAHLDAEERYLLTSKVLRGGAGGNAGLARSTRAAQ